jgi:hypothetical protein
MVVVQGIKDILWPKTAPPNGDVVRKRLSAFLNHHLQLAPTRGPGVYLKHFVEHAWKVTESYWPGLFHCYDDSRIPRTTNRIEELFGQAKHLLRACGGRKSTAVGPGSTGGSFFLFSVAFHGLASKQEREDWLKGFSKEEYKAARRRQQEIREPEARRRRYLIAGGTLGVFSGHGSCLTTGVRGPFEERFGGSNGR